MKSSPKNLKKDIYLLTTYFLSLTLYATWCVIYPYLGSYLKHFDPQLSLKTLFSTTIGLFLGQTVANICLPTLFFLFGIKNTIFLGGFLNFLNCILYIYCDTFLTILANLTLTGAIYQLGSVSMSYFLSEKYENGYVYSFRCFMGMSVANIFWPFLAVKIMNPGNVGMIAESFVDGDIEHFFPWEISKNFTVLMSLIGVFNFFVTFIPIYFIEDPDHIKGYFIIWLRANLSGNKRALNEISKEYSKNESYSKNLNLSNSLIIKPETSEQIEKEKSSKSPKTPLTDSEAKEKAFKIMKSPLFILLIIILTIKISSLYYFIDNYKIIAFHVIKNDSLISLSISVQCIFALFCQFIFNFVWKKFGFFQTYNIISIIILLFHIFYLLLSVRSGFFMFLNAIVNRIVTQFMIGCINFTKFGLFEGKVAVYISKAVDLNFTFAMIVSIFFNYLFFSQEDISTIFLAFFVLNFIVAFLFWRFYRDFEEKMKKI